MDQTVVSGTLVKKCIPAKDKEMTVGEILTRNGTVIFFVAYDLPCRLVCACPQGQRLVFLGNLVAFQGRVTLKVETVSPLLDDPRDDSHHQDADSVRRQNKPIYPTVGGDTPWNK